MLQPGQVIAGRYLLESPIGEGAMGAVFRAADQTLRRQVAIKFLFVKGTRDPQAMVDQFLREARIAASVQHRNVIQTVDFGAVDEQQPFMVMELLSGESLGERMEREPPLTSEQLIHIVSLTLRGLAAVHDAGIVHRDLKPQNIFLQRDADAVYPKILDFGISRSLAHGGERPSAIATQEGLIVGTPDYMSPEQARGEANIDKRSDIYSMAVILYEGLTGRLPFEADTVGDLLVQLMTKEPPTMRDVEPSIPKALSEMVAQAMSKSREHRFADARAMRRALLASAESAVPPGRRAAASVPPPVAGVPPTAGASLPIQSNAIASRGPNADTSAATWGDFEGLDAAQILDNSPPILSHPPSLVPPESPKQQRVVARLADELSLGERPDKQPVEAKRSGGGNVERNKPERAAGDRVSGAQANAAGRNRKSGKKPSAAAAAGGGLDVALDPLYVGADQAAPDIDFDRMPASARKAQSQAKPAQRPRAKPRAELPQQRVRYKRNFWPWVLPAVALFLLGYMFWQPSLGSLPESGSQVGSAVAKGAADTGLGRVRLQVKARRERPGQAPPHMRDVVF